MRHLCLMFAFLCASYRSGSFSSPMLTSVAGISIVQKSLSQAGQYLLRLVHIGRSSIFLVSLTLVLV
jgi:hypothetical protein